MTLKFSGSAPFKDTSQTSAANVDNDAIAALRDDSGIGNHLTQGTTPNRPAFKTGIFGGAKPAFRFDGGDYLLHATLGGQLTGAFTIGCIVKGTDKTQDGMAISWGELTTGKARRLWIENTTGNVIFSGYSANVVTTTNVKDGNPHRIVITYDGTTVKIRVDGAQVASGTPSLVAFAATGFAVGANPNGSEGYKDDLGPLVIVHNTALTGTDLTDLEAALLAAITAAPDLTPTITTASVPAGTVGTAYDQTLTVSSGDGTITWSKQSGTLPPGISFNTSTHKFEGTPTAAGTYNSIVIRATDADGDYDEETYSIVINAISDTTDPTITSFSAGAFSNNSIRVIYAATDNIAVTGVNLDYSLDGVGGWVTLLENAPPSSPYLHTGRAPGTTYYYALRARDEAGNYSDFAYAHATTPTDETVLDAYFERLELSKILNITQLDLEMPVLTADFGDGYGAGALSGKAAGLRYWAISADVLPDLDEYSVDYVSDGDAESDTRFNYLWEFYRRHLAAGNKPFYFVDPRTNRKFLASFVGARISFESLTSKLYRGGIQIKQRRVKNDAIEFSETDGAVEN